VSNRVTDTHAAEVKSGERFEFGRNWARFLGRLNEDRIALAIQSLQRLLKVERLDGKTFLDIGSGSGLFSLAARRIGASVYSFDYDPQSVACTMVLRDRYFAGDRAWRVERGSVLDVAYLRSLGRFDIVYSWGVLHHTGAMEQALDNVKPLVAPDGLLYIAIYNDKSEITDRWERIKQTYNRLSRGAAAVYATGIIAWEEWRSFINNARNRNVQNWLRNWTEYDKVSARGMSRWHDWIDWIGGYPYERATVEQVVDRFAKDGYRLENLFDRSGGYGCNEFVFRRVGELGEYIHVRIPGGNSMVRRFGLRVSGPYEYVGHKVTGRIVDGAVDPVAGSECILLKNERLIGTVRVDRDRSVTWYDPTQLGSEDIVHVVEGVVRGPDRAFMHQRGRMWSWHVGDLVDLADNMTDRRNASPVFVFQDETQLAMPHSIHDDIAKCGGGRFSHWGDEVLFSTRDGGDPNLNRNRFRLAIAKEIS
jgi:2-polyprenyl-3-methyl-5-hydroxy-6-metoxy-1,4-benzoquinol methylase